jgi:hypothetical protein
MFNTDYLLGNIWNLTNSLILLIAVIITIWTVNRQLKHLRKTVFYEKLIKLESEINSNNKDLWGLPENNIVKREDGSQFEINLNKLSYMVCFLDTYALSSTLMLKSYRPKIYSQYSMIYKMFKTEIYRDYWKYIVRDCFYDNEIKKRNMLNKVLKKGQVYESRFINAINKTIELIENNEN